MSLNGAPIRALNLHHVLHYENRYNMYSTYLNSFYALRDLGQSIETLYMYINIVGSLYLRVKAPFHSTPAICYDIQKDETLVRTEGHS